VRRFSDAEIEKLRLMAEVGHDGPTIARDRPHRTGRPREVRRIGNPASPAEGK
jgi:hypothetical protein